MLMVRMRAVADGAETVQSGDAKRASKASVGTSARSALAKRKVHLLCQGLGVGEQCCADLAFERRAIEAAGDFQFRSFVNRPQIAKAAFDAAHVGRPQGPQIEYGAGAFGNYVRARATLDDVGVDTDAPSRVVPRFDARKLRCQLVYSIDALFRSEARVGSAAMYEQFGFSDAFARCL